MSNQYIVKFVRDTNNSDTTTFDGFLELISDKGCPTIFIRTCKESTDPKNENLLNLYVSKNMGKIEFSDEDLTCTIKGTFRSSKIIFDSSSSSAFTDFKTNFNDALNSKYDTQYYPKSGRLMYVGEVLYKENEDKTQRILAHGSGTLYYDLEGQKVKYQGEFSDGNFDGAGKFYSSDSKIVLTANNISNGVPVQKGKLEFNFGKNCQTTEIVFAELWKMLTGDSKERIKQIVNSNNFLDNLGSIYWEFKEIPFDDVKFNDLSNDDKYLKILHEIKSVKTSIIESENRIKEFQKEMVRKFTSSLVLGYVLFCALETSFKFVFG